MFLGVRFLLHWKNYQFVTFFLTQIRNAHVAGFDIVTPIQYSHYLPRDIHNPRATSSLHPRDAFLLANTAITLFSTIDQYASRYTDTRKLSFQFTALMLLLCTSKDRLDMPTCYEQTNPRVLRTLSSYPYNSYKSLCLASPPCLAWIKPL